jgi:malonate-semialdehyde dehydrogenase (acetylating)/methylmalonate-semialdehyde dehydrogenase
MERNPARRPGALALQVQAAARDHFEEIARIVTTEHGKTLDESRGSLRRGIECVEVACGAPSLLMGTASKTSPAASTAW